MTIETTLVLNDKMSGVLRGISDALEGAQSSMAGTELYVSKVGAGLRQAVMGISSMGGMVGGVGGAIGLAISGMDKLASSGKNMQNAVGNVTVPQADAKQQYLEALIPKGGAFDTIKQGVQKVLDEIDASRLMARIGNALGQSKNILQKQEVTLGAKPGAFDSLGSDKASEIARGMGDVSSKTFEASGAWQGLLEFTKGVDLQIENAGKALKSAFDFEQILADIKGQLTTLFSQEKQQSFTQKKGIEPQEQAKFAVGQEVTVNGSANAFLQGTKQAANEAVNEIVLAFDNLKNTVSFEYISQKFTGAFAQIKSETDMAGLAIKGFATGASENMANASNETSQSLSNGFTVIGNIVANIFNNISSLIGKSKLDFGGFANFLSGVFVSPVEKIRNLLAGIGTAVSGVMGAFNKTSQAFNQNNASDVGGVEKSFNSKSANMQEKVTTAFGGLAIDKATKEASKIENIASGKINSMQKSSAINEPPKTVPQSVMAQGYASAKVATGVDASDEEIKTLHEISTRQYRVNYSQITPNLVANFGDIKETADVEKIIDILAMRMEDLVNSSAGVAAT